MTSTIRRVLMVSLIVVVTVGLGCRPEPELTGLSVGAVSDRVRAEFELAPFYQKSVILGSFPVVG